MSRERERMAQLAATLLLLTTLILVLVLVQGHLFARGTESCFRTPLKSNDCDSEFTTYVGAIVEYAPYSQWTSEGGRKILRENTNAFVSFASEAKEKGADILVYSEYGLTGLKPPKKETEFLTLVQRLPDPEEAVVPCLHNANNHTYEALKHLSCAAKQYELYLVVDLIEWVEKARRDESTTNVFYNSQVVFDRSGTLIARYRKKNLFLEDPIQPGKEDPSLALFHTDFGVTFTLQICFDIMYKEPGVSNILSKRTLDVAMSTAWYDELPFLTAPQTFSSWATGLGVNLLVANNHNLSIGATGSGIFPGVTSAPMAYVYGTKMNSSLVVSEITTRKFLKGDHTTNAVTNFEEKPQNFNYPLIKDERDLESTLAPMIHENLSNYTSKLLRKTQDGEKATQSLCHNELCCHVTYSFSSPIKEGVYQILAYSGDVYKAKIYKLYVEVCGLVYCLNEDISSCANVDIVIDSNNSLQIYSLEGLFHTEVIFPSVLRMDLTLVENNRWTYVKESHEEGWKAKIVSDGLELEKNLLVTSLFARVY